MQTVVNCVLRQNEKILMLQKPRRGWWVTPGGKVETGESLVEAITREFAEETGLQLVNPELRGVFSIILTEQEQTVDHWMLFTFYANSYVGDLYETSEEGLLEWVDVQMVERRPMAEGDRIFLQHILHHPTLLHGKFIYTSDYKLLDWIPENTLPISVI